MPSQFPWTNHGRCHTTPGTSSSPRTHLPGTNADWTTCGTARTTTLWASPPRRPSRAPLAPGAKARKPLWSPAAERRDDGTRTRDRRLDTNPRSSQRPGPMRKARRTTGSGPWSPSTRGGCRCVRGTALTWRRPSEGRGRGRATAGRDGAGRGDVTSTDVSDPGCLRRCTSVAETRSPPMIRGAEEGNGPHGRRHGADSLRE